MLELRGLRSAERFVDNQQALDNDVRWVGFDKIVFFRPDPRGFKSPEGAFRKGVWGFDNVVAVDETGTWRVDYRNVRRTKRNRS